MEKFSLQHVVLYGKHWYERSDDFWADTKKVLPLRKDLTKKDVKEFFNNRANETETAKS